MCCEPTFGEPNALWKKQATGPLCLWGSILTEAGREGGCAANKCHSFVAATKRIKAGRPI
jgi:hypothetical protein